jgi:tetratricopeptide (TPR) repeat protein
MDADAWFKQGKGLYDLKLFEEAIASYDQALKIKPDYHKAWNNRGVALENLGRFEEAVASYDQALNFQSDDHLAWYSRGVALDDLGQFEEAVASYDQALKIKPDYHQAWINRGIALDDLGQLEEAIASYDQALKIKPDDHYAWFNRGIAAGKSSSCDRFLASQSSIARKHPALNQRGYEGALASYEQGLKYCPQDTHPEGWGKLHQAIGSAHYFRGRGYSRPRPYWHKALNSYKQALKTLTAEAFPERHLEVLQSLIKLYDDLGQAENRQAVLAKGTVVLEGLLEKTPSNAVKIQLSRKFASFAQFYVDQLVQKGDLCGALEFAEQRKNLCLTWMRNIWSNSTYSPNYTQMQQLLQPAAIQFSRGKDGQIYVTLPTGRQFVGHRAIVYWHISPAAITTFILRYNQPLIVLKNDLTPQPPHQGSGSLQGKGEQEQENQERSSYSPLLVGEWGRGHLTPLSSQESRVVSLSERVIKNGLGENILRPRP